MYIIVHHGVASWWYVSYKRHLLVYMNIICTCIMNILRTVHFNIHLPLNNCCKLPQVVIVVQFGPLFFSQSESSIRNSTGIEACDWLIWLFLVKNSQLIECTIVVNVVNSGKLNLLYSLHLPLKWNYWFPRPSVD